MSKVALIFGYGANIGQAVAAKFLSAGYKVATVSRTPKTSTQDDLVHYSADLSDPKSVEPIFDQVEKRWAAPEVVVYNAAAHVPTPTNPLSAPVDKFTSALNINTVTPYVAASIAYAQNDAVAYIFTGNAFSSGLVVPALTLLGTGKSATSHWIQATAQAKLGRARFYYADQRDLEGKPCYNGLNGEAHAELYLKLAQQEEQGEPLIVFRAPLKDQK